MAWMYCLPGNTARGFVCPVVAQRVFPRSLRAPGISVRPKPVPRRAHAARIMTRAGLDSLEPALEKLGSGFVLFKADWCPDCVRSTDAVRQAVARAGSKLLEVDVADQPAGWKTPTHPLRQDERFKLGGIPTLVRWQDGRVAAKLGAELERAPTPAAAGEVAAAFVNKNL